MLPPASSTPRRVVTHAGLPLLAIIVFGVLTTAMLVLGFYEGSASFLWSLIPVTIVIALAVASYLWIDRWEPEPARLLLGAFLWGGGVAATISLVLNTVTDRYLWSSDFYALAVGAPVFEETTKGLFLLLMMTGIRRREINSITDTLVYAGMVGLGFAFVEDMLYFARTESFAEGIVLFVFRMLMGVFAHPLFTSMTAIGVWFAVRSSNVALRVVWILSGWLLATVMHGIWNGSTTVLEGWGFFIAYGVILVPVFAGMVTLAVLSRRNEGRRVLNQLPRLVAEGIVAHEEALWLASLPRRSQHHRLVARVGGRQERRNLRAFTDRVTELALLRTRLDRQPPTPALLAEHQRLLVAVYESRQRALPILVHVSTPQFFPQQTQR